MNETPRDAVPWAGIGYLAASATCILEFQPAHALPWALVNTGIGVAIWLVGNITNGTVRSWRRRAPRIDESAEQERRLLDLQNWGYWR